MSDLKINRHEVDLVLSSLGYKNHSRLAKEWRGDAKCHGGADHHNFSYHYDKGVARCWSEGCFGGGTDIFGVVQNETSLDFYYSKKYVEDIIGRKFEDDNYERPKDYYSKLLLNIANLNEDDESEGSVNNNWISNTLSDIYAKNNHHYWTDRGFSPETLEFFEAGYNPENNRITIPIFDIDGSLVAIKQRIASDDELLIDDDNPKYLHDSYDAGKHLFNLNNASWFLKNFRNLLFPGLILIEGHLDTMMSHQLGVYNTIATGSNYLTEDQAKLIEKYTDKLLIIPDEDQKVKNKDGLSKNVWTGGELIRSARDYLGRTTTIYTARIRPVKDIGSLVGEDASLFLAGAIMNCRKV